MVFQLPMHLILDNIIPYLRPQDTFHLVCSNKNLYGEFFKACPDFRKNYGKKHKIARCLMAMIAFIKYGNSEVASWGFFTGKDCFVIIRTGKHYMFIINGLNRCISEDQALSLFKSLILPKWNYVEMSMRCGYKNVEKRKEFQKLTCEMMVHLK